MPSPSVFRVRKSARRLLKRVTKSTPRCLSMTISVQEHIRRSASKTSPVETGSIACEASPTHFAPCQRSADCQVQRTAPQASERRRRCVPRGNPRRVSAQRVAGKHAGSARIRHRYGTTRRRRDTTLLPQPLRIDAGLQSESRLTATLEKNSSAGVFVPGSRALSQRNTTLSCEMRCAINRATAERQEWSALST